MKHWASPDAFFQEVTNLLARLEARGHREAAQDLRQGLACLNGLTDGWWLFLDAINRVRKAQAKAFDAEDRRVLKTIHRTVHRTVFRKPWPFR